MNRHGLDDAAMAAEIGNCGAYAVRKWKYGERRPRPHTILRIQEITKGAVTLQDFLPPSLVPDPSPSPEKESAE